MCSRIWPSVLLACLICSSLSAQIAPVTGLHENTPSVHAFIHARIITSPGIVIANGTLLVRDGLIEAV